MYAHKYRIYTNHKSAIELLFWATLPSAPRCCLS